MENVFLILLIIELTDCMLKRGRIVGKHAVIIDAEHSIRAQRSSVSDRSAKVNNMERIAI